MSGSISDRRRLLGRGPCWAAVACLLGAGCATLAWQSQRFGHGIAVRDMPAATLAIGLALAGAVWMALLPLLKREEGRGASTSRIGLAAVLLVGLAMRLALLNSTPALEDDYWRYLWEGGLVAHGVSPYALAPEEAREEDAESRIGKLAAAAGTVLERVNHAHLSTIYPPVAQASFALAHMIAPWSLTGWRIVLLLADAGTAIIVLTLLAAFGRSPLWVALYWWNPLVIKEIVNSAHMDAILMALVMGSLLLLVRKRYVSALAVLALAVGTKVWPLLLAPLYLRPLLFRWRELAAALGLFALLLALMAVPILHGGLDETSGFIAFAEHWQTNSALFPALQKLLAAVLGTLAEGNNLSGRLARAVMGLAAVLVAVALAWRSHRDSADVVRRVGLTCAAIVLLSPAQFPWYMTWVIPFLPFMPHPGLALVTVTTPLYYTLFHFSAREAYDVMFLGRMVWAIWIPVWLLLAADVLWRRRTARSGVHA